MSVNNTITLEKYLSLPAENGSDGFLIPDFQRGYVWGKSREKKTKNSVEYLTDSLIDGFNSGRDVFLQGITYTASDSGISIIDGQQRTTFFYLLLKFLGYEDAFKLHYVIRKESDDFLMKLDPEAWKEEDKDCQFQDIFFFQRTLSIFHKVLAGIDREKFRNYLLNHVRFLCVQIAPDKAETIFTMMNGSKAEMKQEELIKAELLRRASLPSDEIKDVESRDIRGRMAREWDSWLHWWNREDVSTFFYADNQLGWLLPLYLGSEKVSFESFRRKLDKNPGNKIKEAKEVFRSLRMKQRQIQDAFYNAVIYNYIGAILRMKQSAEERFTFLRWYFNTEESTPSYAKMKKLRRYFDLAVIGCNHSEITGAATDEQVSQKIRDFRDALDGIIYKSFYEGGSRWLLRRNILEDCNQNDGKGRKFNFDIWSCRSLEHIYPKSKFGHYNPERPDVCLNHKDEEIDKEKCEIFRGMPGDKDYVNEHRIGNLVLLYGDDNSKFGAKDFQQKKDDFFNVGEGNRHFESRHLIHTISVFASSKWTKAEIIERQKKELADFDAAYSEYKSTSESNIENEEA
ncbi:MAG: DUF262 domain-containing HNH endonuclease family protein [Duncaniella sp.]|nr:DUF262 domain-containing HNH endonuclease family protein [Duncaniella sp.]